MNITEAAAKLRADIRKQDRAVSFYSLKTLLWEDASACFDSWDAAEFRLDLKTHKLSVRLSQYPNQFGAAPQATQSISPEEFHTIAFQRRFPEHLLAFKDQADWEKVFDRDLNAYLAQQQKKAQRAEAERLEELRKKNAVAIPELYGAMQPRIDTTAHVSLGGLYGAGSDVWVTVEKGAYRIEYKRCYQFSSGNERFTRLLSRAEAVWFEIRSNEVISATSEKDAPSHGRLSLRIRKNAVNHVYTTGPDEANGQWHTLYRFYDELTNLAEYGSQPQ